MDLPIECGPSGGRRKSARGELADAKKIIGYFGPRRAGNCVKRLTAPIETSIGSLSNKKRA